MSQFLLLIFLLITTLDLSQADKKQVAISRKQFVIELNQSLVSNQLYIVSRGTRSKSSLIAEKFNLVDTNITHVGLGIKTPEGFFVSHIEDKKSDNAFSKQKLDEYLSSSDVYYCSIYQFKQSNKERKKSMHLLQLLEIKKIHFDDDFLLTNGHHKLYCSEYAAIILNAGLTPKNRFQPVKKQLNNELYESILGRKSLIYFPVDFFIQHKSAQHVSSAKFLEEVF